MQTVDLARSGHPATMNYPGPVLVAKQVTKHILYENVDGTCIYDLNAIVMWSTNKGKCNSSIFGIASAKGPSTLNRNVTLALKCMTIKTSEPYNSRRDTPILSA